MIITKHKKIDAAGTVAITSKSFTLRQLVIVVSDDGSTWKIRVEDNDTPPSIVVAPVDVAAPSTVSWINEKFEHPLPIVDGLDFVTVSGTHGTLDLWYSYDQPSN